MLSCPNVKINLGLNIKTRRSDGYHELETLFLPYDGICDGLEIEPAQSLEFVPSANVTWDNDLTLRAYRLLKEDFPDLPAVRISLDKKAPVGAGLGSGSSDCAFTLVMLNELFDLGLEQKELAGYASRLGSDCPFFVYNRPMFGRGRGEILSPYDIDLSAYRVEVSVPDGISVSTKEAYAGVVPAAWDTPLEEALKAPVNEWKNLIFNDFEKSVFAAHPQIAALKQSFYDRGAVYAAMSGSGSACFGIFEK